MQRNTSARIKAIGVGRWAWTLLLACGVAQATNSPPAVSLTTPTAGAVYAAPASVTLTATASDSDGSVASVKFYSNALLLSTDTVAPYTFTYPSAPAGNYSLTAVATDDLGATTTSSSVSIRVTTAPTVSLTSPTNGASVQAPGAFTLTASASDSDGSINRVEFYSNGVLINTDTVSPYSFAYSGLAAGSYSFTAIAYDNLGVSKTSGVVNVTVTSNSAPTVSLTSPTNGASAVAPATFGLAATAADSDGTVASVKFYADGVLLSTDTASPYTGTYSTSVIGSHTLTAVATDNAGATTTSGGVGVTVTATNIAPTVSLTSPTNGASAVAPATFNLTANAADSDGTISMVEFYADGVLLSTDTASPYTGAYSTSVTGSHTLTAVATDNTGAAATSSGVGVTVTAANNAPTVSLTSPTNGASAVAPATFSLAATAADSDGTVASVKFYADGALLSTDTASPYTGTYSTSVIGSHTLTAVATDNAGATTTSSSVGVTVTATNIAPTVSLASPTNGASAVAPATFNLTANAADSDGTISKVEFYSNGALIATDVSSPYSATFGSLGVGTYSLTAKATDNVGATTTSTAATVTVSTSTAGVSVTRSYVYDVNERLCKVIDPESGATVMDYDAAGNIAWSASGTNLTSNTCDRASVPASVKIVRTYDAMNRVTAVTTPGGVADVTTHYTDDGLIDGLTATNGSFGAYPVTTTYAYNKRRYLTQETSAQAGYLYTLAYGYDGNGFLANLTYPDTQVVTFSPDALGRPTLIKAGTQTYASGVTYYPNGAASGFTYGNGIVHAMTKNARQLPSRSQDMNGAQAILDDSYAFDASGNVTDITDQAQGGLTTRGMAYDSLDRLTAAVSPSQWGNATYTYDSLDNLTSTNQGGRQYRYSYDPTNRLSQINDPNGIMQFSFGYDTQGNMTSKGSVGYQFDVANRLTAVIGSQSYRYDGMGRRVQTTDADGKTTFWVYNQSGQVLYSSEARRSQNLSYIYLGNTQVATRAVAWATGAVTLRYEHTDALGSPVVETDQNRTVTKRNIFAPYGEAYNSTIDGTGYTGHVMDQDTGLTYMQQRYYDPMVGRFLSLDSKSINSSNGANFNRYWYADDNPYKFTDPDGRQSVGELIDDHGAAAASSGDGLATYGWAFASTAWSFFGAEGFSQVLDKGSDAGKLNKVMAVLEVATLGKGGQILKAGEVAAEETAKLSIKLSAHAVDQAITRGVKAEHILDAIRNPLKVTGIKIDAFGRPSQKIIGSKATIAVNTADGTISTIYPTSTSVAKKLLRESK